MPDAKRIDILNGPNLNLLGSRTPEIYGRETLSQIERACRARAGALGVELIFLQSNGEGALIEAVHEARSRASGLVINGGGYSHTSVALLDALLAVEAPVIEVHVSNIYRREFFRRRSLISRAADGVICGLGGRGYLLALEALAGSGGLAKV